MKHCHPYDSLWKCSYRSENDGGLDAGTCCAPRPRWPAGSRWPMLTANSLDSSRSTTLPANPSASSRAARTTSRRSFVRPPRDRDWRRPGSARGLGPGLHQAHGSRSRFQPWHAVLAATPAQVGLLLNDGPAGCPGGSGVGWIFGESAIRDSLLPAPRTPENNWGSPCQPFRLQPSRLCATTTRHAMVL